MTAIQLLETAVVLLVKLKVDTLVLGTLEQVRVIAPMTAEMERQLLLCQQLTETMAMQLIVTAEAALEL